MAVKTHRHYDQLAQDLGALLPHGPRLAVLGSTEFWHGDSEHTCFEIGRLIATIPDLVILTGGVEGIGEAIGRSFFQSRRDGGQEPRVYHVLPEGEVPWDYGETFFAGTDMTERREVLGRLSQLYLLVEGGPGAGHEVEVAIAHGATVLPVGRSGGHAAAVFSQLNCPSALNPSIWAILGSSEATPEETAEAVLQSVCACLGTIA